MILCKDTELGYKCMSIDHVCSYISMSVQPRTSEGSGYPTIFNVRRRKRRKRRREQKKEVKQEKPKRGLTYDSCIEVIRCLHLKNSTAEHDRMKEKKSLGLAAFREARGERDRGRGEGRGVATTAEDSVEEVLDLIAGFDCSWRVC